MSTEKEMHKTMSTKALLFERAVHVDWINSDENDGRLTASSSASLDYACDCIEEIDEVIDERKQNGTN